MTEVHNLLFSPQGVVATGLLTAAIAHNLLYLKNLYSWKIAGVDKAFKPAYSNFRYHASEYIAHVKRIGSKQKTYSNAGDWRTELGIASDASPVAALATVEKLIDKHNSASGIQSQMQLATLLALKTKITNHLDVRSATMRLKVDQKATQDALAGKTPAVKQQVATATHKHPISQVLLNAKPVAPQKREWREVLGLMELSQQRPLTEDDLRAAYKQKKKSANSNPAQLRALRNALEEGRKTR